MGVPKSGAPDLFRESKKDQSLGHPASIGEFIRYVPSVPSFPIHTGVVFKFGAVQEIFLRQPLESGSPALLPQLPRSDLPVF